MLADIDAFIRNIDSFNEAKFLVLCKNAGIEYTAKIILALCNLWFDTPIASKIQLDENTLFMFERVMLDGGVFGLEQSNLGNFTGCGKVAFHTSGNSEKLKPVFDMLLDMPIYKQGEE